jgi:hypothetical protein
MFFDASQVQEVVDVFYDEPRATRAAERGLLLAVLAGFFLGRRSARRWPVR